MILEMLIPQPNKILFPHVTTALLTFKQAVLYTGIMLLGLILTRNRMPC